MRPPLPIFLTCVDSYLGHHFPDTPHLPRSPFLFIAPSSEEARKAGEYPGVESTPKASMTPSHAFALCFLSFHWS